ncbi:MAG: prolyl oligopeptidase family serine peptidase [Planctomycetaceae bacterium]|nr:prolyl oligopeptidase family serine peptidase [Planctomycetales bacterium]MCB9921855.1 prolyl oligopeptidase family serine peptidase [Planctomycetaceae bacterium]
MTSLLLLLAATVAAEPLAAGDHNRKLTVDGQDRTYLVHIPTNYDDSPTPVVLIFHGAVTNADITVHLTGMNKKSDEAGFIAVYPNGTGVGPFLTWNAGGRKGKLAEQSADDVKYVRLLLDDLANIANIDSRRVYATGMSNGGMMCYRLAAEMSDRIAAIAPVAGTVTVDESKPGRPVPVMHFHGTADTIVPFDGLGEKAPRFLPFKSVEESIAIWCQIDGCPDAPTITEFPDRVEDGTTVRRKFYGPGKNGTEVVLIEIEGGGHTWPGQKSPLKFLGKSTLDISANDLIWEFFQKHPMK